MIEVDYYLPGCPPPVNLIKEAILDFRFGFKSKMRSAVLAPEKSLCDICPRKEYRLDKPSVRGIKRIQEIEVDEEACLLDAGLICLGPATRSGCEGRCIKVNMPCRGCLGPTPRIRDQGAAFVGALSSIIDSKNEEEIRKIADSIPDMAGTIYRFTPGNSPLGILD